MFFGISGRNAIEIRNFRPISIKLCLIRNTRVELSSFPEKSVTAGFFAAGHTEGEQQRR